MNKDLVKTGFERNKMLKTWEGVGSSGKMLYIFPERACLQLEIFHHLHIFQLLKLVMQWETMKREQEKVMIIFSKET